MSSHDPASILAPARGWQFFIDRGGTFTDVVARDPDGRWLTAKLLSENPESYPDAAVAGMRRLLAVADDGRLPVERIEVVKLGTTVATNALLERKGEPTLLCVTRGFRDQLRIGYQHRPELFALHIELPPPLYTRVVELDERVDARGNVLVELDEAAAERALRAAFAGGIRSVAVVLMHAWRYSEHERRAGELARRVGFTQVSLSHEVSPLMKFVARGDTTVADAYLSPVVDRYVRELSTELEAGRRCVPLYLMKSNGGLARAARFRGRDAVLSGPAGGIVGMVRTALDAGYRRVIGFDMGGTSTDVSHFAGNSLADAERDYEHTVAGVRLRAPMLSMHTVAAGGGSVLHFDGRALHVGPDSAGAVPGPASYRRGGPLTITDANLLLGKLQPALFPRVFGASGDESLDAETVTRRFEALAAEIADATGRELAPEQLAEGFVRVAVTNMANAVKVISVQRGYDLRDYTLVCFGGAAGQHACLVADELGIDRVYVHRFAGVLSALGMGLSDVVATREQSLERPFGKEALVEVEREVERLSELVRAEVEEQGILRHRVELFRRAHLKYESTDTALAVPLADEASMRAAFEAAYQRRFAFLMPERALVVEAVSVEAVGHGETLELGSLSASEGASPGGEAVRFFADGAWQDARVFSRRALAARQVVAGPAIIAEDNATTVVEPGWRAVVTERDALVLERRDPRPERQLAAGAPDPSLLEVFTNQFMSIAQQMGMRLANSASSVNIKERLDFSCAIFDGQGELVANAPHVPVHLGSMSESIKTVIARNEGRMRPGDAYALNDPYHGGTHLPDVTVVMPVFANAGERVLFYVAARGHHADIGGITPGSMPPSSRRIEEEGVLIDNFPILAGGVLREREFRALLAGGRHPARNPDQNLADMRAQIAACERGREELTALVERYGLGAVQSYMAHVQDHAEESVRRAIGRLRDGAFECRLDSGAVIRVRVVVDRSARSALVDFTGTSAEVDSNFNAPPAVVHAAVLYVFRTLVNLAIPLNAGCLRPISIVIPEGSLLSPRYPAATVAGNVETSQCVTDVLYGALGLLAASQGTMNNFTFGDARHQYYETVAGGSGAGDGFDGTAAVQTHMTNSRLTDPEVLELRFPVLVEEHSIRRGSGGGGRFRGGDGALRRIRFLEPMTAAILANRRVVAPHGLAGGAAGECGATWVERRDGRREALASADQVAMQAGDVFVISTPGGGGYG